MKSWQKTRRSETCVRMSSRCEESAPKWLPSWWSKQDSSNWRTWYYPFHVKCTANSRRYIVLEKRRVFNRSSSKSGEEAGLLDAQHEKLWNRGTQTLSWKGWLIKTLFSNANEMFFTANRTQRPMRRVTGRPENAEGGQEEVTRKGQQEVKCSSISQKVWVEFLVHNFQAGQRWKQRLQIVNWFSFYT